MGRHGDNVHTLARIDMCVRQATAPPGRAYTYTQDFGVIQPPPTTLTRSHTHGHPHNFHTSGAAASAAAATASEIVKCFVQSAERVCWQRRAGAPAHKSAPADALVRDCNRKCIIG